MTTLPRLTDKPLPPILWLVTSELPSPHFYRLRHMVCWGSVVFQTQIGARLRHLTYMGTYMGSVIEPQMSTRTSER
jgi:hypothetical protein